MIERIIIFIFFCFTIFLSLFIDIELNYKNLHLSNTDIIHAIQEISPSVVGISVINKENDTSLIWEIRDGIFYPYKDKSKGITSLGSGLIYSNDGYIITNRHVIKDASEIFVTLSGGKKFKAELTGYDTLTDIALLKVATPSKLPVSQLGDSDNLSIGESVVALGNPLGLFDLSYQPTATK